MHRLLRNSTYGGAGRRTGPMLTPLPLLLLLLTRLQPSIAGGSAAATTPNPSFFAFVRTMRVVHGI